MTSEERAQAHDVLVRLYERMENPAHWRSVGKRAHQTGPGAQCLLGHLGCVVGFHHDAVHEAARVALYEAAGLEWPGNTPIYRWQDEQPHEVVLGAVRKAIAATAPSPDLSFLHTVKVEPEVRA